MLVSHQMRRSRPRSCRRALIPVCAHGGAPEPAAGSGRPADAWLEVLAGIVVGLVAASLWGRASWPRLLLNRMRVAALPAAEGDAMIGELFPEVRQGPVP